MSTKATSVLFLKFPLESRTGGGELHTMQLAEQLHESGSRVFLAASCRVLLAQFKKHDFAARKTWGGIEPVSKFGILVFLLLWPLVLINLVRILRFYKRNHQVQIVYCLSLTEKLLATLPARLMGLQVVWAEHVSIARWLTLNPFRFPYVWFSDFVEVIAVSETLRAELEQIGVSSSRIHVLYCGIDTARFKPQSEAQVGGVDLARAKDGKVITCVARLHPEKGVEYLLRAMPAILAQEPTAQLLLVGEGDEYARLYALARQLKISDRVFFLGYREDVQPFLALADVVVLPSADRESFGVAIAEAMSMEKPVVASDVGGVHELVEQGKSGFLVPPRDAQAIADHVLKLLKNPALAAEFGAHGREIVLARFTLQALVKKIGALFDRLATEPPFRVLFTKFPYTSAFGGGELHTIQLAEGLMHRGAEVLFAGSCQVLLEEFKKRGLQYKKAWGGMEVVSKFAIVIFPFVAPLVVVRLAWLLLTYRLFHKIDVVYCMSLNEKLLMTLPARALGIRVVWVEHLLIERWLIQNPYRFLYIWMSRFVTIVGVSEAVRTQLVTIGVAEANTRVIYNGVDVQEFVSVARPESIAGIPVSELGDQFYPVVGTTCRLAREKGVKYLLQAANLVLQKMPKALFVIAGDGPEKEQLQQLAREMGIDQHVLFVGFLDHAHALELLSVVDLFAMTPVSGESFGIAVAESMMLEKPVVATNIGGIPEVVADKETGYVVRSRDVEAIANAIMQLAAYTEDARTMGQKGRARVLQLFTLERMVSEFYDLFAGLQPAAGATGTMASGGVPSGASGMPGAPRS